MSGSPSFVRQLWGGGINRDRTAVLMSVGYRVIKFRGRHGSWRLVHHHRVGGVTTAAAWAEIGAAFGNPSMEAILSCGFPGTLNTIWDKTSKLNTRGEAASQKLSMKDGKRDNESMSTGGLIHHKNPLCFIEAPSVFTRSRRTRRNLCANELGQAYNQPEQVMARMNNYSTRPNVLPFLTSIPEKTTWSVLQASEAIHEVHSSAKVVTSDLRIGSLGTSLETFKGEALTIKGDGDTKADDAGFQ